MEPPLPSYRDLMLPVVRAVSELGGSGNSREISESVIESEGFSEVNTTDPDSRMLRARNRFVQGFNAQAAVSEDQVVVAATCRKPCRCRG